MADFTNVEVTDTFDQWRIKTNQLGSDFIAFEAQVAEDIANIDLSDFVTKSGDETINGSKTFTGISTFDGQVNIQGNIISGYLDNGVETYGIDLGIGKTSNAQSFIDFNGTGGDGDHAARIWRRDNGVFDIRQIGDKPLVLSALGNSDGTLLGANIELYSKSNSSHPGYAYYDADRHIFRRADVPDDTKFVLIESGNVTANDITANSLNIPGTSSSNKLTIASGKMRLRNQDYTWPSSYTAGRYLKTDAQGNLSWAEVAGGSGSVNLSTLVFNDIVPVGTIIPWAATSLPADGKWKFCNGEEVSNTTYPQIATLLGNRYGTAPNGFTKLPNFAGRVPLGAGGTFSVGGTGGSANITGTTAGHSLTIDQMPSHNHTINASIVRDIRGGGGGYESNYRKTDTTNTTTVGGGQAHYHSINLTGANYQPYLTTQYIIKVLPDDVQQVSINAGNGINVKNASNQDTTTLDLFSTKIELKANPNHFSFSSSGLLQLKTIQSGQIADKAITLGKIQNISPGFVLGKGHAHSAGSPQGIYIDNDLSSVNPSHDTVVSAKAVKDYVDNNRKKLSKGYTQYTLSVGSYSSGYPTTITRTATTDGFIIAGVNSSWYDRNTRGSSISYYGTINIKVGGFDITTGQTANKTATPVTLTVPVAAGETWTVSTTGASPKVWFKAFS